MPNRPQFYTYILTNADRSVLYTGVTNNLQTRLVGHFISEGTFVSKYKVYYLVYYEASPYVLNAIAREDEIKNSSRAQKETLISETNRNWRFLNEEVVGVWPPTAVIMEEVRERYGRNPEEVWR